MELTYIGVHDAVDVHNPDWPLEPTVAQGESFDFPDAIAEQLLEQPSNWQRTQPAETLDERLAKAKKHDDLDELATELDVEFDDNTTTVADKKAALQAAVDANADDAGDAGEEN
jgi:hypothetical protein